MSTPSRRSLPRGSPTRGRGTGRAHGLDIQRASRASHVPSDARLRAWTRAALRAPAAVTLRFVAENEARRLNREFRGRDYATNVLTFVYPETPIAALAGDVVICTAVVAREAKAQGKPVEAHYAHLVVHGLLHLQGEDHEDDGDARRMERRERSILKRLGFPDPYPAHLAGAGFRPPC